MCRREASINDVSISESDRRIKGPRTEGDGDGIPLR
jgi:nuclear transport factor 2 (NTF2) superfamily protein